MVGIDYAGPIIFKTKKNAEGKAHIFLIACSLAGVVYLELLPNTTVAILMSKIDKISCHPKNKLLLYHRFILFKISWHFTIADLGKTGVIENIDNVASKYIRQWFELPISATQSSLVLSKSKYGISLILPSTKFIQCQVAITNALKSSPNSGINLL